VGLGRVRITVIWVAANRTTGGTVATAPAIHADSAVSNRAACTAFPVTDTAAPLINNNHAYPVPRLPARATTDTVATTITPSTINGHSHACDGAIPARIAK
jgi:hypothetical protein